MHLFEFYDTNTTGFQDVSNDNSAPKWSESRKTRLTLSEINKLRRMKEVESFERANDLKKIRRQYSPPTEGGGMPGL
jgi:hypothetical protein